MLKKQFPIAIIINDTYRLTAIWRHDNLSYRAGIVGFQDERRRIRHSVGQNIVNIELVLFQDQFFEQHLHGRAFVRVSVQDRIAAKYRQRLSLCRSVQCMQQQQAWKDLRKYVQLLSRGECIIKATLSLDQNPRQQSCVPQIKPHSYLYCNCN